jgi:hypothetical protein
MERREELVLAQSHYAKVLVDTGLLLKYAELVGAEGLVSAIEKASDQLEAIKTELALLEKEKNHHREHC